MCHIGLWYGINISISISIGIAIDQRTRRGIARAVRLRLRSHIILWSCSGYHIALCWRMIEIDQDDNGKKRHCSQTL